MSRNLRRGAPRGLPGAGMVAAIIVLGSPARIAQTGVVVNGDLIVASGPGIVSWSGPIEVAAGATPQTILGALDVGGEIPATLFGLDVNAPAHWPSIPFGALRLHDSCSGAGSHPCTHWRDIEPVNGGFQWQAFDEWMAALAAHPGIAVSFTFAYTPAFAADPACFAWDNARRGEPGSCVYPGSCCPPRRDAAGNMVEWQDFVAQVVTRAAGRIIAYELWNEPNVASFWCTDLAHGCDNPADPRKLVEMARIAYQTIHQLDPGAVVLTPSSVVGNATPCSHNTDWLAGYLAAGGGQWADVISFHGYLGGCPHNAIPEDVQIAIRDIRALLERHSLTAMPIWDTESSWEGKPDRRLDPDQQAAWVARAYLIRWSEGVQRMVFYGWDFGAWGELWNNDLLAGGVALREAQRWLVGATLTAPCALAGTLWSCPLVRSGGAYKALVVWRSTMDASTTSYAPPSGYVRYEQLDGTFGAVVGPMNVGLKPILLATGAIP